MVVCTEVDLLSVHSFSDRSGTKVVGHWKALFDQGLSVELVAELCAEPLFTGTHDAALLFSSDQ